MNCVAGGETAEYVYTARRNNSLSSSGRRLVFGFILVVSHGREIEVGRHLCAAERAVMAHELARELRGQAWDSASPQSKS